MAGDWIKMRQDLLEDPAVMQMADELETREEHIVGYLHAFWSWVSRQCHDGTVTGVTLASLGRRLNLPGFPEMLCRVGWLDYDESSGTPKITIPKFERHLSQSSKSRALGAERKKKSRHAGVPEMSRSERDKSVTREEKRREEKSKKKKPPTPLELPAELEPIRSDIETWLVYRKEQHRFEYKPTGLKALISQLTKMGPARASPAIQRSMANGWQGIHADRDERPAERQPVLDADFEVDDP